MATAEERRALLAVACPWCGAGPGVECRPAMPRGDARPSRRRPPRIHTLDGHAHDARWRAALGSPAPVLVGR